MGAGIVRNEERSNGKWPEGEPSVSARGAHRTVGPWEDFQIAPKKRSEFRNNRMCLLHREYLLDANDERFGTQLMKTGNWLAYLDAATEAGPQLFLQLCIILRLGYISE